MGAQGSVEIDFGAFPGSDYVETSVAAASILAGSLVEAAVMPEATADQNLVEHIVAEIDVRAGAVVAGVGFTIYAISRMGPVTGKFNVMHVWN